MAFGTLFYAVAATVQIWLFNASSRQTETQINKLIQAAQAQSEAANDMAQAAGDQVDAANNFADTAEEINRQTRAAVDEFHRLAKASEGNIAATQEASRLDQRAWVGIGIDMPPIAELDKPLVANLLIFNSGRTFALKVRFIRTVTISPDIPGQLDYYFALSSSLRSKNQSVGLVVPNRNYAIKFDIPQGLRAINKNVTRDWYITFWGDVTYRDVFMNTPERRTTFCATRQISSPESTFDQCAINNDGW
jgi:hypothetical protein